MRRPRRILPAAVLGAAGLVALAAGSATFAAFSGTTASAGNSLTAGSVTLHDDDGAGSMFNVSGLTPSSPATQRCIRVTYDGSVPANVRLYASSSGALAAYLHVVVTRGTLSSPSFPSCSTFSADATDYRGLGAGVLYDGTLAAMPADWSSGIVDPTSSSPESWTTGETHDYRFTVTVNDNSAAQTESTSATFTWEARNT